MVLCNAVRKADGSWFLLASSASCSSFCKSCSVSAGPSKSLLPEALRESGEDGPEESLRWYAGRPSAVACAAAASSSSLASVSVSGRYCLRSVLARRLSEVERLMRSLRIADGPTTAVPPSVLDDRRTMPCSAGCSSSAAAVLAIDGAGPTSPSSAPGTPPSAS